MVALSEILSVQPRPALLVGNGINRFNSSASSSSWRQLLSDLADKHGLDLTNDEADEMSNTEFFDILDLARAEGARSSLQKQFGELMKTWKPEHQHRTIVNWARRHRRPIITVNFDENLSRSIDAQFFRNRRGFTDYYPWSSYFADREISSPTDSFAIWHAHGMVRYSRSIRLGLTHYMGSVERARAWVYGKGGLHAIAKNGDSVWPGSNTWLEVLFFCPLVIFGFTFAKDENFLRWLFLERARLHKIMPEWKQESWFVDVQKGETLSRKAFFEALGLTYVTVSDYAIIYQDAVWSR